MAGRPKQIRRVADMPKVSGFRPYGPDVDAGAGEMVFLHYEEYEALRICDYLKRTQEEGAEMMGVSRPTFTRIYRKAREKVALAFVEARVLKVEGGKVIFDRDWIRCRKCGAEFSRMKHQSEQRCPLCGTLAEDGIEY